MKPPDKLINYLKQQFALLSQEQIVLNENISGFIASFSIHWMHGCIPDISVSEFSHPNFTMNFNLDEVIPFIIDNSPSLAKFSQKITDFCELIDTLELTIEDIIHA